MSVREKALALTGESMFKLVKSRVTPSLYFLDGGTGAAYHQMFIDCFYRKHKTGFNAADELLYDTSGMADKMLRLRGIVLGEREADTPEEADEAEEMRKAIEAYLPQGQFPGCFPPGTMLGASWDQQTVYDMGIALGKEADYYGIDVLLGSPNVNIQRDPLGGRFFEGYSEDPCLTARLAPCLVKGIQEQGIAANVKHFAANNQETDRRTANVHVPVRALHEIYFPGFRACVQDGGCKTVMSAYNAINGKFCSQNKWLLTQVLRERWGFNGFVVSDWSAVYDQPAAIQAGNDVDMPGPRNVDEIVRAVEEGRLQESALEQALRNVWKTAQTLLCCTQGHKMQKLDREASKRAAYRCAAEGIVLLKNRQNTLPLCGNAEISVFGEKTRNTIMCGGGSANIITDQNINLYDAFTARFGREKVRDREVRTQTDAVIITIGANGQEGFDRKSLNMDPQDEIELQKAITIAKRHKKKVIVILNSAGPVALTPYIDDIDALIDLFIPGMEGANACADMLLGKINPSGKLPHTYPKRYRDCPSCGNFPGWNNEVWYSEGIFVGYRYYDYRNIEPLFPFGYGLSYTSFEITGTTVDRRELNWEKNETAQLTVSIKNTGTCAGKEVIQIYVGQEQPTMIKPEKELRYFQKIELQPGEEKRVVFLLRVSDWASFDTQRDDWTVEPGTYHVYVGNCSRGQFKTLDIQVTGYDVYGFNEETVMGTVAATPGALEAMCAFCPEGMGITKESIEASILYQPSGSVRAYWKNRVEPELPGSSEEKEAVYQKMLHVLNRFK